jgi:hypothetical protein
MFERGVLTESEGDADAALRLFMLASIGRHEHVLETTLGSATLIDDRSREAGT